MQNRVHFKTLLLSAAIGLAFTPTAFAGEGEHSHEAGAHEHGHTHGPSAVEELAKQKQADLRKQFETEFAIPSDTVIAEVNGKKITQLEFLLYFQGRLKGAQEPIPRDVIMRELINRELVAADADEKGWSKDEEFSMRIEFTRKKLVSELAAYRLLQENPVTDEDVEAYYDEILSKQEAPKEYRARHILVKTEEEAKDLIKQVDAGADFAELAEQHSQDKGSAAKGGDLDWFRGERMVAPFAEAVAALEKGKYTMEPVQTDFGWHIILLEDVRDMAPPPFEQVKSRLAQELHVKRISDYIDGLRDKAEIKIHEVAPPATAKPESEAEAGQAEAEKK